VELWPPYSAVRLRGVEVRRESIHPARQEFDVYAPAATEVEAATFYYPGWTAEVDQVPVVVSPAPGEGTIRFALAAGAHHVVLALRPTPLRRGALAVTAASLAIAAAALALRRAVRAPAGSPPRASAESP
jgi:hypothetical protein